MNDKSTMPDMPMAKKWLSKAIARHQRHMAGKEPTSGADGAISQKLMMEEMKYSLDAMNGEYISTGFFYDSNIKKFPALSSKM